MELDRAGRRGLCASTLKWIAVVTMLIDHFAIAIYWQMDVRVYEIYRILRYIGRIAFPIYCFLLVEGFFYTRNVWKYVGRCFIFALLSEIPFNMAIYGKLWYPQGQNVYFTLTFGLCALIIIDKIRKAGAQHYALCLLGQVICIGGVAYAAQFFEVDYHWKGVLFIVMFYYCRNINVWARDLIGALAFSYELTAPLAFIPIHLYNGRRGKQMKYLFYAVYPVHLLLYGMVRFGLNGYF